MGNEEILKELLKSTIEKFHKSNASGCERSKK